jgi:hypothetical protein
MNPFKILYVAVGLIVVLGAWFKFEFPLRDKVTAFDVIGLALLSILWPAALPWIALLSLDGIRLWRRK